MPSLWRMVIHTKFPGGSTAGTNTWHFQTEGATFNTEPPAVTAVHDFYNAIAGLFGSNYSWSWDGVASNVATATPALQAPLAPWTVQGASGGGGDSGPAGVGLCITWRSVLANKNGRGRTFIAPLPAGTYQADGTILDTALATVRDAAAGIVSANVANDPENVVVYSQMQQQGRVIVSSGVADRVAYLSSRRT